ncbi:UPF0223 family protein [Sporosarcina luteola]|uniref:UPF0223 family protein n=1 Tax=Sporosarcina luteola TaxID=582850 RepID=UPI00203B7C20|nr:UPF0223 family protein [Sporosarcina luteola]MCM3710072.1 UPF0223 family protein [Sporosarcina luteola]
MDYNYPLSHHWSTEEIIDVVAFFQAVEKAYEKQIARGEFMDAYKAFKKVVPSMAEEKTIFKEFEEASGFNSYRIVKKAKEGRDGDSLTGK